MKLNDLTIKHNSEIDLDEYMRLRDKVANDLEHLDWVGDLEKNDVEDILNAGGDLWVCYDGDNFVCSMMGIPNDEASRELKLDANQNEIIDYGPMFVTKEYRGNKLQLQSLKFMDEYYKNRGYKYAVSTVSPDNNYSTNNFLLDGFSLVNTREFRRGIRSIYIKKIGE